MMQCGMQFLLHLHVNSRPTDIRHFEPSQPPPPPPPTVEETNQAEPSANY